MLDHTIRNFREQFWFGRLMDRRRYGEWVKAGRKTLGDRVRDVLPGLLKERHAPPLPASVAAKIHHMAPE